MHSVYGTCAFLHTHFMAFLSSTWTSKGKTF